MIDAETREHVVDMVEKYHCYGIRAANAYRHVRSEYRDGPDALTKQLEAAQQRAELGGIMRGISLTFRAIYGDDYWWTIYCEGVRRAQQAREE